MTVGRLFTPTLLGLVLLSAAAAAEEAAPQPAAAAGQEAEAEIRITSIEATPSAAEEAELAAAGAAYELLLETAESESLGDQLEAKLADLVERELLSPEGAAELKALLAEMSAGQTGAWTIACPAAAGEAGASAAPSALLLELQGIGSTSAQCPLVMRELSTTVPGLAIAGGREAEALRELEISIAGNEVNVEGSGLSPEEMARIEQELSSNANLAEGQTLVLKLDSLSPQALAELESERAAAPMQAEALAELEAGGAAAAMPAEALAEIAAKGFKIEMPREALAELEGLGDDFVMPAEAMSELRGFTFALPAEALAELEGLQALAPLAGVAGVPAEPLESLNLEALKLDGLELAELHAPLLLELQALQGQAGQPGGRITVESLAPELLLGIQGLQGDNDKTKLAALLIATQLLSDDESLDGLLPDELRKLSADEILGRLKLKDGWENDLERMGDRLSVMLKGFLRSNSKKDNK